LLNSSDYQDNPTMILLAEVAMARATMDVPVPTAPVAVPSATSARNDAELVESWLSSLGSTHTRRNFETTAARFLAALARPLRQATVEDVRLALETALPVGGSTALSTARQYVLRVKSLLSYAHRLGYTPFNAGVAIKSPKEIRALAKRIVGELDVRGHHR
jgi:integrase/recombinase XerD